MTRPTLIALVLVGFFAGCRSVREFYPGPRRSDAPISIVRVLADPAQYHQRRMWLSGYLKIEREGDILYLHETDYRNGLRSNGVWVRVPTGIRKRATEFSGRYVRIEGIFDATQGGYTGMCAGRLESVTRIMTLGPGEGATYPRVERGPDDPSIDDFGKERLGAGARQVTDR